MASPSPVASLTVLPHLDQGVIKWRREELGLRLKDFLETSEAAIPTISIPNRVAGVLRGKSIRDGTPDTDRARWVAWLALALVLPITQILSFPRLELAVKNGPWTGDAWMLFFGLIAIFGLWSPKRTWTRLIAIAPSIEHLLNSERNVRNIKQWLASISRPWVQYGLPMASALGACLTLFVVHNAVRHTLQIDIISYLMVALIGFIGMSGAVWVLSLTLLVRRIVNCEGLNIMWHDPVHSKGIVELSRLLGRVFATAMIGAAALSIALFTASAGATNGHVRLLIYSLLGLGMLVLVFVGVAPQIWLSARVHDERNKVLRIVGRRLVSPVDDVEMGKVDIERLSVQIHVYRKLSEVNVSTVRTELAAVYAGAALTGFAPLLVQIVSHH